MVLVDGMYLEGIESWGEVFLEGRVKVKLTGLVHLQANLKTGPKNLLEKDVLFQLTSLK